MTAEMTTRAGGDLATSDAEWSVEQIVAQTLKIQECMKAVMKRDEHYGVIPGTGSRDGKPAKPTLLKPGAEKLCLMFRLCPEYETLRAEQSTALVSYTVRCTLTHIPSGNRVATGLGSCNSREKKYTRPADRKCPTCSKETIIKGKDEYGGGWLCYAKKGGCGAKFKDGDAAVEKQDLGLADPSDLDNTILKMACKRALVAAVLNGTAASDCFTQDLEDLAEKAAEYIPPPVAESRERIREEAPQDAGKANGRATSAVSPASPTPPANTPGAMPADLDSDWRNPPGGAPKPRTAADVKPTGGPITPEQIKAIHTLLTKLGNVTDEAYRKGVAVYRQADGSRCVDPETGKGTSKLLSKDQASHLISRFEDKMQRQEQRAAQGVDIGAVVKTKNEPVPSLEDLLETVREEDDVTPGGRWLDSLFGVDSLHAMDKTEKETALALLLVYGTDKYDETETKARALGRIR